MLDSLRGFATTWFGKVMGAFLLVGLAGFGVTGVITGLGSNTIAHVGSEEITIRDFQRAYNSQLNAFSQQLGQVPTAEQAVAFGIPSNTIGQLASDGAITSLARDFGLGASDERIAILLRQDPNFAGTLGNFDSQRFQQVLQAIGYTENEYIAFQNKAAQREQFNLAIFGGVKSPKAAENLIRRYGEDKRSIDYFVLTGTGILPPAEPTAEEIATYLSENQALYRTKPTRTVKVMVLAPEAIANSITLSDEEIAAEYERTKANYITAETRDVRQVVLPSDTLVNQFQAGLDAGASFDELVSAAGLTVTELGTLTKAAITDTTLAEAAFSLADGSFALIPSVQGTRAVSVHNIVPGGQKSLTEATADISERLKTRKAKDDFVDVLDQIEELRAAFRPIDEISERFGLEVAELDLTSDGVELAAVDLIPEDGRARVAQAIFGADIGDLAPTVALNANLNVWFDLEQVEEARDQTIDEVGDAVKEALLAERTAEALKVMAEDTVADIQGGKSFDDVAVALGLFPQLSQPFTRNGSGSPVIDGSVAAEVFNGGNDIVGSAMNSDGDYVIFKVSDVTPAEVAENTTDRTTLDNALVNSLYNEFVGALRNDMGVQINQNTLAQAIGLDGNQ